VAYLGRDRSRPRGLGGATVTTSATFFPHCEHRTRVASSANVIDLPAMTSSAGRESQPLSGGAPFEARRAPGRTHRCAAPSRGTLLLVEHERLFAA
jgi:hypothetical protein